MGFGETYNNNLDKINGQLDRFSSLLSTNKEKTKKAIVNSILVIIILIVYGCFDFMNWKFDFTRILTSEYWTTIISKLIAAICSFNVGININWDNAISRAIELKNNIELYNVLIKQKDDENFDYYINHIYNVKIKRRAYINYINKKIHRLNKFSKDKDIALYSKKIPLEAENYDKLVKELEEQRANNKYCIRRAELEYLKSEEYIKENIDSLGVRYTRVDPSVFDLDIRAKVKEDNNRVVGNVGVGKAKASSSVGFTMLGISMITTSIIISVNQQEFVDNVQAFWFYLLTCVVDAGLIFWNLFRGTRTSANIISEQLTTPYANRNKALKSYIAWKEENNIQPSKSFNKINELCEAEQNVVEITMEEYQAKYGGVAKT